MRPLLAFLADLSPEAKGFIGTILSLSLADWSAIASIFAALATGAYMLRKNYLLRAPIPADSPDAAAE